MTQYDEAIWNADPDLWKQIQGKSIFMTGGTGFFGKSLLEFLQNFKKRHDLKIDLTILTRDPENFKRSWPSLCQGDWINFLTGDILNFNFPNRNFDLILHFATPANAILNIEKPLLIFDTILQGSRRVLEFARKCQAKKVLFASSGAIYGPQPSDLTHIPETYAGAPSIHLPSSSYGEAKRAVELMGNLYSQAHGFEFKTARCFAFVGPHLDPSGSYAIGNFISDANKGRPIEIKGDGTPFRSYLYADDLCLWLLKILMDGKNNQAYNVGSDEALSIQALAEKIIQVVEPGLTLNIQTPRSGSVLSTRNVLPTRYVPSIELAKKELGLNVITPLKEAIQKTSAGYRIWFA